MEDCPLPEVAEALGPYIRPRQEVARIRQELQTSLRKQIPAENGLLLPVTLTNYPNNVRSQPAPSLSGVRKAYLNALEAHAVAQAKYDALKADLARLTTREAGNPEPIKSAENLVALLRRRETQRKLHVLDRTFSQIDGAGKVAINGHLDELIRTRAGELPLPPTAQATVFGEKPDLEARVLQLKKAVLSANHAVNAQNSGQVLPRRDGVPPSSQAAAEVAGLQSALNELTVWMEHQLAIIGEAEGGAQSTPQTPATNGHPTHRTASIEDIEALYEQYLSARQRLILAVNEPPALPTVPMASSVPQTGTSNDKPKSTTPAEALLPYISTLVSTQQEEQSLQQQSAYLRRQTSSAEAETQRLIARLADESHLVHPGAAHGRDWAEAAAEASKVTKTFARERIVMGESAAATAQKVLRAVENVPVLLDNFAKVSP